MDAWVGEGGRGVSKTSPAASCCSETEINSNQKGSPEMKKKQTQPRIFVTRRNGEVIGYARHNRKAMAERINLGEVVTEEVGTEDLIRIGRDGAEVKGMEPVIDPNQRDLPL
jgi:hypothetical protein